MKTLWMTKGLPGSGKSTWAKNLQDSNPGAYKRVNKDDLRAMLDNGKWSRDNEKFVLAMRDAIVVAALGEGKHCIVDDTGLAPKHEARLRELAKQNGAAFEIKDFTDVPIETCIERDLKRPASVGESVIRKMYRDYLAPKPEAVKRDPFLDDCVIVDVDGTVALMNGRGPFEWDKVDTDIPNKPVCRLVEQLEEHVFFLSGRDESCREKTAAWLNSHVFGASQEFWNTRLFMRPAGDMRDDRIIKREIYEREIKGKYNVAFVLDDRRKVVDQWRLMGLTCLQVAEGNF